MFAMNNVTLCSADIKIAQTLESLDVTTDENKYQEHICGRKDFNHTELISVRTEAKAGDWPWHVAIYIHKSTSNIWFYKCGGTIVSMTAVLTACQNNEKGVGLSADEVNVVAGTNNIKEVWQIGSQTLHVKEVVCNPNYSRDSYSSDLAILKVDRFKYTAFVQPICIWGPIYAKSDLFGRQATVVGFGRDIDNNISELLRAIFTTVQNDTTCLNYRPVYKRFINEFTFCAGDGPTSETNIMHGDSGGGLVIPVMQPDQKVSWFLRGVTCSCVVSSPGKCNPHHYGIYTDVGHNYNWIIHHSGLQFKPNPNQQDYV